MKLLPALMTAYFLMAACNDKDVLPTVDSAVAGSWGYSGFDGKFLLLTNEGKVEKKNWDTFLPNQYYRYEVLTDSTIRFFKIIGQSVTAKYSLSQNNTVLHLSNACIYDCNETFGRILPTD